MKTDKRAKARAAKRAAKAARYALRKDPKESNSKYAERFKARLRGVPMSSRSHEGRPWWALESETWKAMNREGATVLVRGGFDARAA